MIVSEAHRLRRKVAVHAHGSQAILWATEAGADSIEHGSFVNDENIAAMKQHGTYLVPTLYAGDFLLENMQALHLPPFLAAKAQEVLPAAKKNLSHAFQTGVKVALGTDAGVYPHGDNWKQLPKMVEWGMKPIDAIRAATVNGAEIMGWSDRVGSIEKGHYADIIAVDGDPLTDISVMGKMKLVVKSGEVYRNDFARGE